jgi:hypothetical protein
MFGTTLMIVVAVVLVIVLLALVAGNSLGTSVSDSSITMVYRPIIATDIMNEDGDSYSFPFESEGNWNLNWIGTGADMDKSYLGIRFSGDALPKGAKVTFAQVEIQSNNTQIVGVSLDAYAESTATPATYSVNSKPSLRKLTSTKVPYANNVEWIPDNYYQIDVLAPIQEVVSANPAASSFNVILKGSASEPYGRKFIINKIDDQTRAPKLVIKYTL